MSASTLRAFINATLRAEVVGLGGARVLNAGSTPDETDRGGKRYRDYFPDKRYMTLDLRGRPSADHQVVDLCDRMSGAHFSGIADVVLCMSVLEHVRDPHAAARNLALLTGRGGYLFVSVPWFFPKHEGEGFGDYWRFSDDGLRVLFGGVAEYWVRKAPDSSGFCALFRKEAS